MHINNKSKGSSHERCAIGTTEDGVPMFGTEMPNAKISKSYGGLNKSAFWSRCYAPFCKEETGEGTWRWMSLEEARRRARRFKWAGELAVA